MRRFLFLTLVMALTMGLVACTQGDAGAPEGLALGSAPWSDGDALVYDWVDKNGSKAGGAEFGFAKDGDAWVLSAVDKFPNTDQTAKVRVDAQTLEPLSTEKTIKSDTTDATINTTYQNGKLDIKAVVGGEDRAATIDVPENAIDNDQLLMTLRALQFAEGYEGKCVIVVGQNAAKVNTTVRVKGKEAVEVPAGSIEAWIVELDFGQAKQMAWYQVEAPHNLVKYDNGNIALVLTK